MAATLSFFGDDAVEMPIPFKVRTCGDMATFVFQIAKAYGVGGDFMVREDEGGNDIAHFIVEDGRVRVRYFHAQEWSWYMDAVDAYMASHAFCV